MTKAEPQYLGAIERYTQLLTQSPTDLSSELRLLRHKHWIDAARASLDESKPANLVCSEWSSFSLELLDKAWNETKPKNSENPTALFAVGKLGAGELNLSSDVDLMILSKHPPTPVEFEHLRAFKKVVSEVTEFGFCFRVDFDLRPGGRFGPLINSVNAFQDYLWSYAALWERIAFVRFKAVSGSSEVQDEVSKILKPFIYRKYLDYSLFDELLKLRSNYQESSFSEKYSQDFNLKLGVGGIRDLELYINSLQVIHGGKQSELQLHSTTEAIDKLSEFSILEKDEAQFLKDYYWQLRQIENKVQSIGDQQTHILDKYSLNESESQCILSGTKKLDELVSEVLGKANVKKSSILLMNEQEQRAALSKYNLDEETVSDLWPNLQKQLLMNYTSESQLVTRSKVVESFLSTIEKSKGNKSLALHLFLDFLRSIRAKASFFNLLDRKPQLIEDLAYLFSLSPYLGGVIASRPEIIDNFVYRQKGDFSEDLGELLDQLVEYKLISEVLSSLDYLKTWDLHELNLSLTSCADFICQKVFEHFKSEYQIDDIHLLALGKWGGEEMGVRSDLDFVFVCEQTPTQKHSRFTRNFMTSLTSQARGGRIYEIDLRLRPSGSAGPMLVTVDSFKEFLETSIPVWQKQSYLRSRWLGKELLDISSYLTREELSSDELYELRRIREKLLKPSSKDQVDMKYNPGGLIDIELGIQSLILHKKVTSPPPQTYKMMGLAAQQIKDSKDKILRLQDNYYELRKLEQLHQMTQQAARSEINKSSSNLNQLALMHKIGVPEMFAKLSKILEENQNLLKDLDPIHSIEYP